MTTDLSNLSIVTTRMIDGIECTLYRSNTNPRETYIGAGDILRPITVKEFRSL
jgi:hypothetical protein